MVAILCQPSITSSYADDFFEHAPPEACRWRGKEALRLKEMNFFASAELNHFSRIDSRIPVKDWP
jgi:hypothetical protein